jgi:hypothetical protein
MLQTLSQRFETSITDLVRQALRSTCFLYNGHLYYKTDGFTMDSTNAQVVAIFCVEQFEQLHWMQLYRNRSTGIGLLMLLSWSVLRVRMKWGSSRSISRISVPTSRLQWRQKQNYKLVKRKPDGTLTEKLHRKLICADLYLQASSLYHSTEKCEGLFTLARRTRLFAILKVKTTFRQNGCIARDIHRVLSSKRRTYSERKKPSDVAAITFTQRTSARSTGCWGNSAKERGTSQPKQMHT